MAAKGIFVRTPEDVADGNQVLPGKRASKLVILCRECTMCKDVTQNSTVEPNL